MAGTADVFVEVSDAERTIEAVPFRQEERSITTVLLVVFVLHRVSFVAPSRTE